MNQSFTAKYFKTLVDMDLYIKVKTLTDRQKDRQRDRQIDRETDRETERQTDRQTDRQTAREDGATAVRREERKAKKYQLKVLPGGLCLNFVPLVMEHFGRWGRQAQSFLSRLSQLSKNIDLGNSDQDFKCYWRRRFAVALQGATQRFSSRR